MKLKPKALGLTFGILWGATLLFGTLIAVYNGYLTDQLQWLVGFYPWYELSYGGAVIGGVAGFIDGFVTGAIAAWLYNYFACCGKGCCESGGGSCSSGCCDMGGKKKGKK